MDPTNLQEEWSAVSATPYISMGILLAVVGIVWAVLHFLYKHRLDGLKRDLESEQAESTRLRGRLTEYEQKAGKTPDEAHARIEELQAQLASLAPRRLSGTESKTIRDALRGTTGHLGIIPDSAAPEVQPLARDIRKAFEQAGWTAGIGGTMGVTNPPACGLRLRFAKGLDEAAKLAVSALRSANLSVELAEENLPFGGLSLLMTTPEQASEA